MSILLIATDIVTKIAEGDISIVDHLQNRREEVDDIVLFSFALAEGIEKAENATAEGMHAIARLICLSGIDNISESNSSKEGERGELLMAFLKYDFIFKCIVSQDADNVVMLLLNEKLPSEGVEGIRTYDAQIVAALLCLRDSDMINTSALGQLLKVVHIDRHNNADRDSWNLSEEFIEETRTKALEVNQCE